MYSGEGGVGGVGGDGDSEVRNLDVHAVADQHIARFDVAVNDAASMRIVKCKCTLIQDAGHLLERQQLIRPGV